ncbi:uncharacterized protein LOC108109660 [Drosophila eugracilis]|uniref:uncharacterized protein LOC108109660 n=1 Tax=Drosophila eugracilis TaxID=29029 RepID=UPI0007E78B99|nr:uncharacterized protein LOC108109660 [Drosophila eugracilis]
MQSQKKLYNYLVNMTRYAQQAGSYSTRPTVMAMQALPNRQVQELNFPKTEVSRSGLKAGDRLPTAVSLLSRSIPANPMISEVKTAHVQYEKSLTDLAKSARSLYKNARLRDISPQKSKFQGVDTHGLGTSGARKPRVCHITERLTKLFF